MKHWHFLIRRRFHALKGSALVSAAVVSTVLAVTVSGFLAYINHEYYINFRSFTWTQALHLAEAGVEDGFFEINERYPNGSGFLSANGWQAVTSSTALQPLGAGDSGYTKTVTNLTDASGKVVGSYVVQVINPGGSAPYLLAKGMVANNPYGANVSRLVKVVIESSAVFNHALFAKTSITGSGNMYTDSYISTDPAYSTGGQYVYSKRRGNGDIASNGTASNTIQLSGNAEVNGTVAVGPGGSLTTSGNASVGPLGTPNGQVVPGYFRNDMAADIPDATLPSDYSTLTWTSKGNITSTTTLTSGDYRATAVNMSGNTKLTFSGNVRLYVSGNFATSGNLIITLLPGASVKIYIGGSVGISGNGDINNSSTPDKLQFYGLNTCTSVNISGNGNINAVLYAPHATVNLSGNGDISGSVVAKTISMSGNGNFHYDEALKTTIQGTGYKLRSWEEISISQQ